MPDARKILRMMAEMPKTTKKDIYFVAAKLMGVDAKWEEDKHKRDRSGKFTSTGGGSAEKQEDKPKERDKTASLPKRVF